MPASVNILLSSTDLSNIKVLPLAICSGLVSEDYQVSYTTDLVQDFSRRPIVERLSTLTACP